MSTSQRHDGGWQSKDMERAVRTQITKLSCKADWPVFRNAVEAECYARNSLQHLKYPFHVLIDWQSEQYLQHHPELAVKHAIPSEGLSLTTSEVGFKVTSSTTDDTSGSSTEQQKAVKEESPTPGGALSIQVLAMDKDWKLHCLRMDKLTYLTIYNCLHTNQHHLIQGVPLGNTFTLWTTLKNFYQRKSLAARRVLWSSFWSMNGYVRSGSSLDLFVAHLEDLARRLNEMGETVAASHILGALLNGLPKEYEPIITVVDAELPEMGSEVDGLKLLVEIKDKLRDFSEKHKLTAEGPKRGATPRANAFLSAPARASAPGSEPCRNHASGRPCASTPCPFSHKSGSSQSRPPFKKKDSSFKPKAARDKTADTCKNCGKKGHWARDCRQKHAAHVARASAGEHRSASEESDGVHWAFLAPLLQQAPFESSDNASDSDVAAEEPDIFAVAADVFATIAAGVIEDRNSPSHFGSEYSSDVTGDGAFPNAYKPRYDQHLDLYWRQPLTEVLFKNHKILRNDLGITHFGCCYWQLRVSRLFQSQVWRDSSRSFKMQKAKEYKIELLFLVRQLGPDFCLSDWMGPEFAEGCLDRLPLHLLMDSDRLVRDHPYSGEMTVEENQAYKFYTLLDDMRRNDGHQAEGFIINIDAYFHGPLNIIIVSDDFSQILPAVNYRAGPRASHVAPQGLVLYKKRYEMVSPHTLRPLINRPHGGAARLFGDSAFPGWNMSSQRLIPNFSATHLAGPESFFVWTMRQLRQANRRHHRMRKLLSFIAEGNVRVNLETSPNSMQWTSLWTQTGLKVMDLKEPPRHGCFGVPLEVAVRICPDYELALEDRRAVQETVESCRTQAMNDIAEGKQLPLPQMYDDMLKDVDQPLPQFYRRLGADEEMLVLDQSPEYSEWEESDDEPMSIKIEVTAWRCKLCAYENDPSYDECFMCRNTPQPMITAMKCQAKERRKKHMASVPGTCPYF
jgi:hypothetical protein